MLRRTTVLFMVLVLVGVLFEGVAFRGAAPTASIPTASIGPVLPIGSEILPAPPFSATLDPASPDMDRVWAAAILQEPSPSLATPGETMPSEGKISLTFDDGPNPDVTPQILDTLKAYDVRATFFVVGRYVEQHPEIVRLVVEEGHNLGNHGYSHTSMSDLGAAQINRELQRTQEAVDKALGYHYPMFVMRPPYGHPYQDGSGNLPLFQEVVKEQELFPVMWTPSPHDYLLDGQPERIIQDIARYRSAEEHDEVLLLHDTKQQTADALPGVIEFYMAEDLEFTSVQEFLADKYLDE